MTKVLEVRNLVKEYPGVKALQGVDLDVLEAEVHCLLGPNGAGKSTLIKCVSGAVEPTSGEILFMGEPLPQGDPAGSLKRGVARIACLYLPNGNPVGTEKYPYKLKWMSRLLEYSKERLKAEEPLVLAGDFNVIPAASDVYNPAAWANDALFKPETREAFQSLLGLGLTDALRAVTDEPNLYTFWDYQAGAWQKNWGIRIDHLLLSPQASDRLTNVGIDSYVRAWEKPSDHVPVWADFDLETA